jgi:hypothetical protein
MMQAPAFQAEQTAGDPVTRPERNAHGSGHTSVWKTHLGLLLCLPLLAQGACDSPSIRFCSEIDAATKCEVPCKCMEAYGSCLKHLGCEMDMYGDYMSACWQECKVKTNSGKVCPHPGSEDLPEVEGLDDQLQVTFLVEPIYASTLSRLCLCRKGRSMEQLPLWP